MTLRRYLISLFGAVMLAVAVGLFIHSIIIPRIIHKNRQVRVPNVLEMTVANATEVTSSLKLQVKVIRSEPHPSLPVGAIMEQAPVAGSLVREGRLLAVVCSNGPHAENVPMLSGLNQRKAESTIQRRLFKVGSISKLKIEEAATSAVAWQYPSASRRLQKGEPVDIVIAEPVELTSYCMPDLTGQTIYSARAKVELAGCAIAPVKYERRPNLRPNTVIDQKPAPGSRVIKGETIELVASTR